jgi:hypothetical protein
MAKMNVQGGEPAKMMPSSGYEKAAVGLTCMPSPWNRGVDSKCLKPRTEDWKVHRIQKGWKGQVSGKRGWQLH